MSDDFSFALEKTDQGERFVLRDQTKELGYMTVDRVHEEGIIIAHTIAHKDTGESEASRQKRPNISVGMMLFDGAIAWAAENNRYIVPVCPYVLSRFEKYPQKAATRAVARG